MVCLGILTIATDQLSFTVHMYYTARFARSFASRSTHFIMHHHDLTERGEAERGTYQHPVENEGAMGVNSSWLIR